MTDTPAPTTGSGPSPVRTVFRLPRTVYIGVLFLAFCTVPFAFGGTGVSSSDAGVSPLTALMILPIAAWVYIARTRTVVDTDGIAVRLVFGGQLLPWERVRGVLLQGSAVYAVLTDGGAVRLPCVSTRSIGILTRVSGGHLPALPLPVPKQPPGTRRR